MCRQRASGSDTVVPPPFQPTFKRSSAFLCSPRCLCLLNQKVKRNKILPFLPFPAHTDTQNLPCLVLFPSHRPAVNSPWLPGIDLITAWLQWMLWPVSCWGRHKKTSTAVLASFVGTVGSSRHATLRSCPRESWDSDGRGGGIPNRWAKLQVSAH